MFARILSVATLDSIVMSCLYLIFTFHPQLYKSDLRAEIQYVSLGSMRSRCQDGMRSASNFLGEMPLKDKREEEQK